MRRYLVKRICSPASWLLCPILTPMAYCGVFDASFRLAYHIVPRGHLLGLEFIGLFVLGLIGGVLMPLTFNIARLILVDGSLERRVAGGFVASLGGAFNGYLLSGMLMIPILAWLHSLNSSIPYLGEYDNYRQLRDIGAAIGGGLSAVFAAWVVQSFESPLTDVPAESNP